MRTNASETIRRFLELNEQYEQTAEPLRQEIAKLVDRFIEARLTPEEWLPVLLAQMFAVVESYRVPAGAVAGMLVGSACSIFRDGGKSLTDVLTVAKEVWSMLERRPN